MRSTEHSIRPAVSFPRNASGRVVGVHHDAIVLRWEDGSYGTVVDPTGDDYPWGVRLARMPTGVARGAAALADGGRLSIAGVEDAGRVLPPRPAPGIIRGRGPLNGRHRSAQAMVERLSTIDAIVLKRFDIIVDDLPPDRDALSLVSSGQSLIGAGSGLTPFGDDLLVGALAALSFEDPLPRPLQFDAGSTTELSAWFLGMATRHRFGRCLRAVAGASMLGDASTFDAFLSHLLRFGATSGLGMALGVEAISRSARRVLADVA